MKDLDLKQCFFAELIKFIRAEVVCYFSLRTAKEAYHEYVDCVSQKKIAKYPANCPKSATCLYSGQEVLWI